MKEDKIFIIVVLIAFIAAFAGTIFITVRTLLQLCTTSNDIFTIVLSQVGTGVTASAITAVISIIHDKEVK